MTINLLTGPVEVRATARRAMLDPAAPHRSDRFLHVVARTDAALCEVTGAAHAQVLLGSGTLANDVVAAQLSRRTARGLVLSNGEFGDRLASHASRFGLDAEVIRQPWGQPFDLAAVGRRLRDGGFEWLWCVQLETSTGVLNDVAAVGALCAHAGTSLCLDTISALGLVPVDLRRVRFASGVSGKGLRAYPGLAVVFYDGDVEPDDRLPRYLDLGLYARAAGVPFTHSTNLVRALNGALRGVNWPARYAEIEDRSRRLRDRLRALGFTVVAAEGDAAPGIVTIALPSSLPSERVADAMERAGILLGSGSDYLRIRNWIQLSLMSQPSAAGIERAVATLAEVCRTAAPRTRARRSPA